MGFVIDINQHVSIELRRESVTLYVESAGVDVEFDYGDVNAIETAMRRVKQSDRYKTFMHAQRVAEKTDIDKTLAAFPPGSLKL